MKKRKITNLIVIHCSFTPVTKYRRDNVGTIRVDHMATTKRVV